MNPPVPVDEANAIMATVSTDWTVQWGQFHIEEDDGSVTMQWGYLFRFDGSTAPQMLETPELHFFPEVGGNPALFILACNYVDEYGLMEASEVAEA